MTTILTEGKLTFEFSDEWQVYKYDEPSEENFYHKHRTQGLEAVDFIARSNKCILLMEVKYVLATDEASLISFSEGDDKAMLGRVRQTLSDEDRKKVTLSSKRPWIVEEVVKKAKDSLLGLLASRRQSDDRLSDYNQSLLFENKRIVLVLFLERNEKLNQHEYFKPIASKLKTSIEQKINFIGDIQVLVVNSLTLEPGLGLKARLA